AEHHLEIDRLKRIVLIAVDHSGWAGDAFPRPEPGGHSATAFIFHEDVEIALQHEKALLHFVRVRRIALATLDIHDGKREIAGGEPLGLPEPPAPMKRCCARL